jgi:replicative DNA helicase
VRADFVADLVDAAAPSGEIVRVVEEYATRRAMVSAADELRAAAHAGDERPADSMDRVLHHLSTRTAALGRHDEAPAAAGLAPAWLARVLDRACGPLPITTGLLDLDHKIPGELPRGEVTIVGARTGIGKSAFLAQIAAHNARLGRRVLVASAEMTTGQLLDRWAAATSRVPLTHIRQRTLTSDEERRLRQVTFPETLHLFDRPAMTTGHIRALVTRFALEARPLDLVAVDHLHHLADPTERGESRYVQVGRMVAVLKDVAKRHGCVLLVAAQLNRQAADREPTLADLRDAGTIEEFAHLVVFLHRTEEAPAVCQVIVAKHRDGPSGRLRLHYDAPCVRFGNFTRATGGPE